METHNGQKPAQGHQLKEFKLEVMAGAALLKLCNPLHSSWKIKAVSDLTPNELINLIRLKKAASMLAEGDYRIYEIAGLTGFSSQSNFARNFLKQFKMTPSDYIILKQNEKPGDKIDLGSLHIM